MNIETLEPESRASRAEGFCAEARRGDENPWRAFDEAVDADAMGKRLLEVCFVDNPSGEALRKQRTPKEYLRIDSLEHPLLHAPLNGAPTVKPFSTIVCWWALEFTPEPWNTARRIESLLAPDGRLFVSVPWIWDEQPEHDDYYRFSPAALHSMFEGVEWEPVIRHSTTVPGEILTRKKAGIENQYAMILNHPGGLVRKYLPFIRIQMTGRRKPVR
jgi:hypothetical protein